MLPKACFDVEVSNEGSRVRAISNESFHPGVTVVRLAAFAWYHLRACSLLPSSLHQYSIWRCSRAIIYGRRRAAIY